MAREVPPNDRTQRCGRPVVPELASEVARPHSLQWFCSARGYS
jgi:hypothetical protein